MKVPQLTLRHRARPSFEQGRYDSADVRLYRRPVIRAEQEDGEGPARQVLFAFHPLVIRDEGLESFSLDRIKQATVCSALQS
jgi:hypothetical protein